MATPEQVRIWSEVERHLSAAATTLGSRLSPSDRQQIEDLLAANELELAFDLVVWASRDSGYRVGAAAGEELDKAARLMELPLGQWRVGNAGSERDKP